MKPFYLYAVKDAETEKLIGGLTNPPRKFWLQKFRAQEALDKRGGRVWDRKGRVPRERLKVITLKVEEVPDGN